MWHVVGTDGTDLLMTLIPSNWLVFRPGDSGPKEAGPEAWPNGLILKMFKPACQSGKTPQGKKTQQTAEPDS